jgi:hypothetical protein
MWEREYHHVDLHEGEHRIGLIDRTLRTRNGEPARWLLQIACGDGGMDFFVGKHKVRLKLGHEFQPQSDGTLKDSEGNSYNPRDMENKLIERLNAHHEQLRQYARKQGAEIYQGPRK